MAAKPSSFDHGRNDEIQESKTFAETKAKLAARGFTDRSLIFHCDKTPQCAETYISAFKALNSMQAVLAAGDHISKTGFLLQKAKFVSDCYYEQTSIEHKIALGNCLAVIGFPDVTKEICIKLLAEYPNIFSYDRVPWKPDSGAKTVEPDLLPLEKQQDLLNVLMMAAINYTYFCDAVNIAFNDVGLVPILVKAFDKLKDCTVQHVQLMDSTGCLTKKTVRGKLLSRIMGTLYNLAKRVPTRPNFHASNTVSIVLPLIDDKVNLYATMALLILAYLIDEGNNNLIMANKGPIKYLISLIEKATHMSQNCYRSFSNSELAEGLAQIAINDSNKKQIVANGAIPVLTRMIKEAQNDEDKIAAAEALWVLAFDEENKEKIKENDQCMELLRKLKENVNEQVKKAASGALWEIEGKKHHSSGTNADVQLDSATTNHVMISYQWDVQSTMIRVKDRLQAAGFRVWIDVE